MNTLFYELRKILKYRTIQAIFLVWITAVLLLGFATVPYVSSSFELPIQTLSNLSAIALITFIISMSGYVLGVEVDFKTLKIIRAKSISAWKFILIKMLVAIIYSFVCFAICFFISTTIGLIMLPQGGINFNDVQVKNINNQPLAFVIHLYVRQFIASIFIVSISFFTTLKSKNSISPIFITFCIVEFLGYVVIALRKTGFPVLLLPGNSEYILGEYQFGTVNQRIASLLIYSALFFLINIYLYKIKDVKI